MAIGPMGERMGGFKRFCLAVWSLAGLFAVAALAATWFGPWADRASALMVLDGWVIAVEACGALLVLGLLVTLLRALLKRRVRTVEVVTVDGGVISVTKDAIASQAAHVVEADGTCEAARVIVDAKRRGHVRVHVRVLPLGGVDVVEKGAELHQELLDGLAAVCGDKVEDVSLEFVTPASYKDAPAPAPAAASGDVAAQAVPVEADVADSTSEITVPMGSGLGASKEA